MSQKQQLGFTWPLNNKCLKFKTICIVVITGSTNIHPPPPPPPGADTHTHTHTHTHGIASAKRAYICVISPYPTPRDLRGRCLHCFTDPTILPWRRVISTDGKQYSWAFALSLATLPVYPLPLVKICAYKDQQTLGACQQWLRIWPGWFIWVSHAHALIMRFNRE